MLPLFQNKSEISNRIVNFYARDQRITNLVEGTRLKGTLFYENGSWVSCNKTINLQKKTIYPLWIKRWVHTVKIKYSKEYKQNFNEKINKISKAFENTHPSVKSISCSPISLLEKDPSLCADQLSQSETIEEKKDAQLAPILSSFLNQLLKDPEIDLSQFTAAQNLSQNPIIDNKSRYISIFNQDDFYKFGILPTLKALAFIVSKDSSSANLLLEKWQINLYHLAITWKDSGSIEKTNDDPFVKEKRNVFNYFNNSYTILTFFSHSSINLETLLYHFQDLDIPEDFSINFNLTDEEALKLLSDRNKDLSPFFEKDSPLHQWPSDCQYLMALTLFNFRKDLVFCENDQEYRNKNIRIIERILKYSIPTPLQMIIKASTTDSWLGKKAFDLALSAIVSYISTLQSESELKILKNYQNKTVIPQDKLPIFNELIAFAKTEKRQKFDAEKNAFLAEIKKDLIKGIINKHNDEFNLQEIVQQIMDIYLQSMKDLFLLKNYLTNLTPENKSNFQISQSQSVIKIFRFMKKHSAVLLSNKNYLSLIHYLDHVAFPKIREAPFIDLEVDPFIPWFIENVLLDLESEL